MPVTLKADIPQDAAFPVGDASTSSVAWTYNVTDAAAVGGVVATSPVFSTRTGQAPRIALTARVPVGNAGLDLTVTYQFLDLTLSVVASGTLDTFTATSASGARTVTLPTVPDGARYWLVKLVLNEGASEVILRTNRFTNPRFVAGASVWYARNSWTITQSTSTGTGPISGIDSYLYVQCGSAATGTNRGIDLWVGVDAAAPAGYGLDVTAGTTVTVSGYMRSSASAGGTIAVAVRFFNGTTWSAAATYGTGVAGSTTAWTRVSVTATVPAGATKMGVSFLRTDSFAWAVGNQIRLTCVLIETAASLGAYFDGTYSPDSSSVRWQGATGYSFSEAYTPGEARNRSLVLTNVTASVEAGAEEVLSAALERPLRRSVYDALNTAAPQIAVGTPGLLKGTITYLCNSLEEALAVDVVYQFAGMVTLTTGTNAALDGFTHMAVESTRMDAEKALPGKPSKWLVRAEVREVQES